MQTKILLFVFLACFVMQPFKSKAQAINLQDSLALVDLYNGAGGIHWAYGGADWLSGKPVKKWAGVIVAGNRVTALNLGHFGLTGPLPSSIGNLTELTSVNFEFSG